MLQQPQTPTLVSPQMAVTAACGLVLGWILKSLLMSGFKNAVLDAVKAELDARFEAFEKRIDAKIDLIRAASQIERRGLPPRGHSGDHR